MGLRARRPLTVGVAVLLAVGATACSHHAASTRTVAPPTATSGPLPDVTRLVGPGGVPQSPPGELLIVRNGAGPTQIGLPSLVAGKKITVRVVCAEGGGRFEVDGMNGQRALVFSGGCDPQAIYGAQLTASSADSTLALSIAAATDWRLAVWQA
jgi:hypothetical protein